MGTNTAKFDLSLYLNDGGDEISGLWEYNCDLFDLETVERMSAHFKRLLAALMAEPEAPIGAAQILGEEEKLQIRSWNQVQREYPDRLCVHALFEAQVRATPQAIALLFEGESVTYEQLNGMANVLARKLQMLGIKPDVPAAIYLPRSLEMVVAVLAVLKAGGPYLPLDPTNPEERLHYMLEQGGARVVLTSAELKARLPVDVRAQVLCVELEKAAPKDCKWNCESAAGPAHLAYIIYTSGSTGRPKGVGMSHRALVNLTCWQNKLHPLEPGSRTLQYNSFGFDVSFLELSSTLSTGGTLVLVSEKVRRDPGALVALLSEMRVGRLFLPYTGLAQLVEYCDGRGDLGLALTQLISGGEALQLTPKLLRFIEGLPQCRLHNEYGPTETHFVTEHALGEGDLRLDSPMPPIGGPIANSEVYVLDDALQQVPLGVVGELYAGGAALARGYVGKAALTAERFLPNPFSAEPGARMYRTGDLARRRSDGVLELLGRRDHQVKIRGFRVELGEVEVALSQHDSVREVVVAAPQTTAGTKRLVAYIVCEGNSTLDPGALTKFLGGRLPDYMTPTAYVALDALPKGATGKVDRYRLPEPTGRQLHREATEVVPPDNDVEAELVSLWRELLELESVSVLDNFFSLGGHSLLVVQLATRMSARAGVEIGIQDVFEAPILRDLASLILVRQIKSGDAEELTRMLAELEAEGDGGPAAALGGAGQE